MKERRGLGIALVLMAALLWSTGGVGIKVVEGNAFAIAGWRSLFALPILLATILVRARTANLDAWGALRRRNAWIAAVSYAAMVICFVVATKLTTAANAIFIQYTGPVYVALLSAPLLGERLRPSDWIAVGGTLVGMALFFADGLSVDARSGNIVAIVSSFGFAGMPLAMRMDQAALARAGETRAQALAPLASMIAGNAITVLVCSPAMTKLVTAESMTTRAWVVVAALGAFQIGLPYVLYGIAVRHLRAIESSLVAMIEPILSPIWVLLATGERPGTWAIVGGAIIVATLSVQALGSRVRVSRART
jgi:drug/metabolite transporter (DMT)-like permease